MDVKSLANESDFLEFIEILANLDICIIFSLSMDICDLCYLYRKLILIKYIK